MAERTISHYRLRAELGNGGMGIVYRAYDERLEREVALKRLHPDAVADPVARARMLSEARLASKLNNPGICTIYEVGEAADGQVYIGMELIEGEPLSARLAQGPLSPELVLRYGRQLADAVAHAHARGIIHRDLKSSNVMITPDGRAKVLDFGVAKHLGAEAPADGEAVAASTVTGTGVLTGTLAYMAPELLCGERADARSDIWALGVVLYEMAGGRRPFHGKTGFELTSAILHESIPPLPGNLPRPLAAVVTRCLAKDPAGRFQGAEELRDALGRLEVQERADAGLTFSTVARALRRPKVAVPAAALLIAILAAGTWLYDRRERIRWAREEALPDIERLVAENDVWRNLLPAYRLAEQAERYIPDDPRLAQAFSRSSLRIDVTTEPPGASVWMQAYDTPDAEWVPLGVSPLQQVRVPIGVFRWRFEKDGYETVLAASSTWMADPASPGVVRPYALHRVLERAGTPPSGMVRVENTPIGDFYIDRHEVTNREYKAFVDGGGYHDRRYWKHAFVEDGRELTWEEATKRFVDQTGRPGPATWQAGDYPEGQADYPVSGVSWYEAAAHAEYTGRSLPTALHWEQARGGGTPMIRAPQLGGNALFLPFSNFNRRGPVRVGTRKGVTAFGAEDMAGNVREWCFNETPKGRLLRGGAWGDNVYMFGNLSQAPAMDRSPTNGFRRALSVNPGKIPASVLAPIALPPAKDFYKEQPVTDAIFRVYKEQFAYDRTDLRVQVEERIGHPGGWIRERVTFDAAYGGERVILVLFLPRNVPAPYQTVVYLPGSASLSQSSSRNLEAYYEFPMFLSFLLKSGRAVAYPVYKGTFERRDPPLIPIHIGADTHQYTEFLTQVVKDFRRSIDYLETRDDIDATKLAYYGMSWGGILGAIVPAVEPRITASVLVGAGLRGPGRPEANQINYVGRVRTPTLILGGKYDALLGEGIRPFFDLLGTAPADKALHLYDTDHIPPRNEMIKETLAWLDRYLGPVK